VSVFAVLVLLWYVPVIVTTGITHIFIGDWRRYGARSYYALYGAGLALCGVTALLMRYLIRARIHVPESVSWFGVGAVVVGLGCLLWSYKTLSLRHLAWFAEIMGDPRDAGDPVRTGPYKLCRNPIYSSALLVMAGAGLASGVLTVIVPMILLFVLLRIEDGELRTRFGAEYEAYAREVPLLFGTKAIRLIRANRTRTSSLVLADRSTSE